MPPVRYSCMRCDWVGNLPTKICPECGSDQIELDIEPDERYPEPELDLPDDDDADLI